MRQFASIYVLVLIFYVFGCSVEKEQTAMQHLDTNAHIVQEIWKSKMILSKAGSLQAVVNYGHMMKFDTSEVYFFDDGVNVDFFNKGGKHSSHLTSSKGEYNGKTEDVIGKGNVHVQSDNGEKLRTDRLKWDSHREKIISDTLVQIITLEQDTLYGVGFESNADLSRRVIHKLSAVSDKYIDFDKFEESLSRSSVSTGTTVNPDTTIIQ